MRWPGTILREAGILSMNQRNADFIMLNNARRLYPLVDDKLKTKELAKRAGIAVPALYGVIRTEHAINELHALLGEHKSFVVKPAHGSGGNGILVITDRRQGRFVKASGSMISRDELGHHISNILSGMFSLGGMPDQAMIEYCVQFDPIFEDVAFQGVPDIRTIVFRGVPVASMVRLPTRADRKSTRLNSSHGHPMARRICIRVPSAPASTWPAARPSPVFVRTPACPRTQIPGPHSQASASLAGRPCCCWPHAATTSPH